MPRKRHWKTWEGRELGAEACPSPAWLPPGFRQSKGLTRRSLTGRGPTGEKTSKLCLDSYLYSRLAELLLCPCEEKDKRTGENWWGERGSDAESPLTSLLRCGKDEGCPVGQRSWKLGRLKLTWLPGGKWSPEQEALMWPGTVCSDRGQTVLGVYCTGASQEPHIYPAFGHVSSRRWWGILSPHGIS